VKCSKRSSVSASSLAMAVTTCILAGGVLASSALAGGPIQPQPKMGEPIDGLTPQQLELFFEGRVAFMRTFAAEDGLGPVFNQNSCSSCHNQPVGGSGSVLVTRFGFLDKSTGEFDPLEHLGGSLFQQDSINIPGCEDEIPEIANVIAQRLTNSTMGLGLVEAVPDSTLEALEASGTGRIHWVEALEDEPGSPLRAGRMGWKAQVATVLTFSADASRNELGFTNRLIPEPVAPKGDESLLEFCDLVPNPNDGPDDDGLHFIDRITDFQRFLAPPPQTPRSGMTGEQVFTQIGCAECHTPSMMTADDASLEDALRNREIKPYSDFLLHNMGLLGDGIEQGDAGQLEFRTPALWGVRIRDPLLHDGRVSGGDFDDRMRRTTPGDEGVIWWHGRFGSSALASANAFFALSTEEQDQLIAFLDSLGRAEFDFSGDNVIGDNDLDTLIGCYTGTGEFDISPDDHCAIGDINQDGMIDETDFAVFVQVYEGELGTCELWEALAAGVDPGISVQLPAECLVQPGCTGDLNGDDVVNVSDLLILLGQWGACEGCLADLNGDGVVNVSDLLILLGAWGPCDDGGPKEPTDSCVGNCGGQSPDGCWCDGQCVDFGDCCDDACDECGQCEPTPGSCVGSCGGQSPDGCWCDGKCVDFGDCCDDACDECGHCDGGTPAPSCAGSCGGQSPDGCWCDEKCAGFGDCCDDVCKECGDLSHC
jgi:cytochrome c551/c552